MLCLQETETKFLKYANITLQEQVEIVKKKARHSESTLLGMLTRNLESIVEESIVKQVASVMDKNRATEMQRDETLSQALSR